MCYVVIEKSSSYIPTSKLVRSCSYGQISLKTSVALFTKFLRSIVLLRKNSRFCSFSQKILPEYLRVKYVVLYDSSNPLVSVESCSLFTFDVSIYNNYQ